MASRQTQDTSMLLFESGGKQYLLASDEIERIVAYNVCKIYPLPVPDKRIDGLLNLNGQIVAVLRFSAISRPFLPAEGSAFIIVRAENERFAFYADSVIGVREKPAVTKAQNTPTVLSSSELLHSLICDN